MLAVEVLVGVAVLLVLAFVLSRDVEVFDDEPEDSVDSGVPDGRALRSEDIPRLRFRVGLRGYRMADVDAALDAVQRALAAAEGALARPDEALLAEQPPPTVDRPLSEMERSYGAPDESR
jgi:DivIVA domain-containing protein